MRAIANTLVLFALLLLVGAMFNAIIGNSHPSGASTECIGAAALSC